MPQPNLTSKSSETVKANCMANLVCPDSLMLRLRLALLKHGYAAVRCCHLVVHKCSVADCRPDRCKQLIRQYVAVSSVSVDARRSCLP